MCLNVYVYGGERATQRPEEGVGSTRVRAVSGCKQPPHECSARTASAPKHSSPSSKTKIKRENNTNKLTREKLQEIEMQNVGS